jgi:ketosteroid isomerase-like protein
MGQRLMNTEVKAVLAANEEMYAAFEAGDLDRMTALWVDGLDGAAAKCVHPGGLIIRGIEPVLRSWALVMANTENVQFIVTDIEQMVSGDMATVNCVEIILRPGTDGEPFASSHAVATNAFVLVDGRWRMWLHHASPVMVDVTTGESL